MRLNCFSNLSCCAAPPFLPECNCRVCEELKCLKECSVDFVTRENHSLTTTQTNGSAGSFYLNIYVILPLLWKLQTRWRRISCTSISRTCSCVIASLTVSPSHQHCTMTALNVLHLSMTRIPHRERNCICPCVWPCLPGAHVHVFLLPCQLQLFKEVRLFFFREMLHIQPDPPINASWIGGHAGWQQVDHTGSRERGGPRQSLAATKNSGFALLNL